MEDPDADIIIRLPRLNLQWPDFSFRVLERGICVGGKSFHSWVLGC